MNATPPTAKALFVAAINLPPDARPALLHEQCGTDDALRQRVEALVAAHDRAATEHPDPNSADDATATFAIGPASDLPDNPGPVVGAVIGPYALREQIGEGGMGLVFVAEQTEPVRRKVALKVIKPGMDSRQVVARFEAERQALALMDHPNIAKVFDAGTTREGRPYFVMELVKGEPVTDYCDHTRLTIRRRLELFLQVCRAVQHAHQKGVIHRDLKPSNVLVAVHDVAAVAKVIDFGIAKAVGRQLTDRTVYTGFAQMVGTPLYMSPEQAGQSSLDVDTRTDVYSLGVLLYELLTGTTPIDRETSRKAGLDELRRIIQEVEPPRPSARLSTLAAAALSTLSDRRAVDPRRLVGSIRGELDWVVMKCLEKDRDRRYDTASALAADIERYLADEPIAARPPSAGYRLRKFVRRNRRGVVTAGAVIAALVVGTAVSVWQAVEASAARKFADERREGERDARLEAEANYRLARKAVKDTVEGVANEPVLQREDLHALRRELLAKVVPFYEEFVKHRSDDPALEEERGRAYGGLAKIRGLMGDEEAALAGFERMREIFARLVGEHPGDTEYLRELGNSDHGLGTALSRLGRRAESEEEFRRSLAIRLRVADASPGEPGRRLDVGHCYNDLGVLLSNLVRNADAGEEYRRAREVYAGLAADHPTVPEYRIYLAKTHHNIGNLRGQLGDRTGAEEELRRAQAIRTELVAQFPLRLEARNDLGMGGLSLGFVLVRQQRLPGAEVEFRNARDVFKKLSADFPTLPQYRERLSAAQNALGLLLNEMGFPDRAEPELREALAIRRSLIDAFPSVPRYAQDVAIGHSSFGSVLKQMGKLTEAEAEYRKAVEVLKKLVAADAGVPSYAISLGATYCNLGHSAREAARTADAESWYALAAQTLEGVLHKEPRLAEARQFLRNVYSGRARLAVQSGRFAEAVKSFDRALELELEAGPDRPALLLRRATCLVRLKPAEAIAEVEQLLRAEKLRADDYYEAAQFFAVASGVEKNDSPSARHAARAVEMLGRAADGGYFGPPKRLADMKKETDLAPIRDRDDYRKLVERLEKADR